MGERERERRGGKHRSFASRIPPTRDLARNPAGALTTIKPAPFWFAEL